MKIASYCNKIIRYSFYSLFFFVPLIFFGNTSELFEFNKMWLTFGLTIVIGAAWISKMIIERTISVKRTPLDIPIILFLISQIISTIFSFDSHVSFWGYYTRFNGGLLSLLSYIFLYYALISNLQVKHVMRILLISLISGIFTALWGFPSHFGYDPTCLVFRGSLDTNCWTDAFKPTVRVFSTLGQPAWFAAYLNVLLPLSITYFLINAKKKLNLFAVCCLLSAVLFYTCLIFTNTRAGNAAFIVSDIILWLILFSKKFYPPKTLLKHFLILHFAFTTCSFFFGAPIDSLNKFTLPQLQKKLVASAQVSSNSATKPAIQTNSITDSGDIRLLVWRGAIDAWKAYPVFGTGVETFAFAYYRFRPPEHNMTSEWDYLYNKAHNEYLNYLTTTGIFGLGSYIAIIGTFMFLCLKKIKMIKHNTNPEKEKLLALNYDFGLCTLIFALFASYISILITNFFGFSVVIISLYFFLIPAFFFIITKPVDVSRQETHPPINLFQWTLIITVTSIAIIMSYRLYIYWYADTAYALGNNYDKISSYQQAYPLLEKAVNLEPNEPVYKDELAINLATLAQAFYLQNDATTGAQLAEKAINLSNQVIENHPNNVVYWKNRLRILYSLGTSDRQNEAQYLKEALRVLVKSSELAPTDAKISYNLGVLLGQTGSLQEAVKVLEKTTLLKPGYVEAYSALGLFYHQLATDQTTTPPSTQLIIKNPQMQQKAINTYQYILDNFSPNDDQIKNTLKTWKEEK
ncbi:O-antigen ligase family protein [Patescibacteria group bacterium]|nr:O-antigen ligase family protein [Patescibacteria group bacterium]